MIASLFRLLWLPPWRRAPLRTARNASLLLGLLVASFVLAVAGGSRPMLASSAATETLRRDLEVGCRYDVGLQVTRQVGVGDPEALTEPGGDTSIINLATARVDEVSRALDADVGTPPGIAPAVITVEGGRARLVGARGGAAGQEPSVPVALVARSGAEDHIQLLAGSPREDGVWLADVAADAVGAAPGDEVTLDVEGRRVPVEVAAIYRDLRADRDRSWCSMGHLFVSPGSNNPPPPVVLTGREALLALLNRTGRPEATATWEYAPTSEGWYLPRARASLGALEEVAERTNNIADPLGRLLGPGDSGADVVGTVRRAERASVSVDSMAAPVALGTVGVAVLMLLAAARSWLQRHHQELTVLALRGAGPAALGAKAALELLVPMVAGAAMGLASAVVLIRTSGPSPHMEAGAIGDGIRFVALALLAALVGAAAVVAASVRRVGGVGQLSATTGRRWWWEVIVLALAAAALYELRTRQSPLVNETEVDALLLLFPLLLLVGGAGLLARLLLAARPLAWLASRLPTTAWLATRRLAAARVRAGLIVTGAALAVGIVVFASTLSASLEATAYAKKALGPGAAQVIRLREPAPVPDEPSIRGIHTPVTRASESGVIERGHDNVDVLGVEPGSFADAAFWDDSFADRSLPGLLELLEAPPQGAVPAVAVGGDLPERFELTLDRAGEDHQDVNLTVAIAGEADAFPGYRFRRDRPLVVVHRDTLSRSGVLMNAEVWIDDPSPRIAERLARAGMPISFVMRPGEDDEASRLQPQTWATDYLEVVGLAAGLVTVAALGLYFAANATRRKIGAALARQLGLRAWRSVAATGLEVGTILAAGFVFGTVLAWLAVRLVFRELDPLPASPPAAILRPDLAIVVVCGAGALLTALVATGVIERRAARASLPELLRDGR